MTQYIVIFQDTSLVYVISIGDFFRNAVSICEGDGKLMQMLVFAGFVYWAACSILSGLIRKMQQGMTR